MAASVGLDKFLARARRRRLAHLIVEHAAIAAATGLGGSILLLLLGTQILNWYWPLFLMAAAATVAAWRMRRGFPSLYAVARSADNYLASQDTLSTAHYFRHTGSHNSALYELQQAAAERLARHAAVEHAVPFSVPRSFYLLAGVAFIAATLFAVRYGMTRSLNLERPIADFRFSFFEDPPQKQAKYRKSIVQEKLEDQIRQLGLSPEPFDTPVSNPERMGDMTQSVAASPDGGTPLPADQKGAKSNKPDNTGEPGEDGEQSESSSEGSGNQPSADSENPGAGQQGKPQNPQSAKNQSNGSNSSSLAEKIRDALANLAQKFKPQTGQQQASTSASANAGANKQQSDAQRGTQGQGRSQPQGQPNGEQSGDQEGNEGTQAQAGQPKGGEKISDRPGSQDGKNGMGKQDGSKEIREAQQLAAMGKISEIIGKRSAQVTGEMTVEVSSANQQLKTSYTQRKSAHSDLGGEIARDEIPLIYQSYVQRYFEEVRKAPAKAKSERVDR